MDILRKAGRISPELRDYIVEIAGQPLWFGGDDPLAHSRHNHVHLWSIEWHADRHREIDLAFRERAVAYIFSWWARRLTGYRPYRSQGYRLYLYQDLAPTVSVVAETPVAFPYSGSPLFVRSMAEVLEPYASTPGTGRLRIVPRSELADLLEAVEQNQGSIGTPTARALGISTAAVRKRIEQYGVGSEVNRIRKRFKRRPARFTPEPEVPYRYRILEIRLPAGYDPERIISLW